MELKEVRIKSVTPTTEEIDMYDLEVEGNHNYFLGNGILTHNSINLLKAASESENQRVLTKSNYSKVQEDLPDKFICRCKFIFDYNNLYGLQLRDDFEALVSRGDFIEVPICDEEVHAIMKLIAKDDNQREVTEFLVSNFKANGMFRLNLRTQWKAFKTLEFAEKNALNWRHELKEELANVGKIRALIYSLIGARAVRTTELKKLLLKYEMVNSIRTAERRVREWMYIDELYKVSEEDRNFYVCINPRSNKSVEN